MKYGKIENGLLILAPHRIVLNEMQIFNPMNEQLVSAGYKPIVETDMPEESAPDGQHYEEKYTDSGETIIQSWILVDDESVDSSGKTIEQRVTALEYDVSGINSAIERGLTT